MTAYSVHANGVHGPFPGLNAVADELVDQWFTRPGPSFRVVAVEGGTERPLREHEHQAIVTRLVQIAQEHIPTYGFEEFMYAAA